jgi:hypothetical protein
VKITIVACLLAALLVAGAACGGKGSDNGEDTTIPSGRNFRGGGLSFTYPTEWRVREAGEPMADADYQVRVGPPGQPHDQITVTIAELGIVIEGKNLVITRKNVDENKELLVAGVEAAVGFGGGELSEPPTRVSLSGLPGYRYEVSHISVAGGGKVDSHITDVFKGTNRYTVACVYTPDGAPEIKRACDQVLGSFHLS